LSDPQSLDTVFDAFWSTKDGGTGVGLTICRSDHIQAHVRALHLRVDDQSALSSVDVAHRIGRVEDEVQQTCWS
jgi:nitrogen-specific signal transduction histidine kinase